jgi:type I restriction enzyme S subunit
MMDTYGYARPEVTKHSHAEWLGEVPTDWDIKKMKYLFRDHSQKGQPDATLLSVTQGQGVVPRTWVENRMVMPSGNLESFKFIEKEDFAISLRSFEGGLEYCHHDGIISPAYTVLKRRHANLDSGYYRYLFKSYAFISELQTSVVGIREGKNISFEELSYSLMPIPPLSAQRAIAAFLDDKCAKIDGAVKIKEDQIALLRERRQIIIQDAVTRGLNPAAPMKDSGIDWIGQIPEHWENMPNKYLFNLKKDTVGKRSDQYDLLSLTLRGIIKRDMENPEGKFPAEFDTYQEVCPGDFVFCHFDVEETPRTVGLSEFFGMITGAYTVYSIAQGVDPRFLLHFYIFADTDKKMRSMYKGLRNTIPKDAFGAFKTPLPPIEEQRAIVAHIDDASRKIEDGIAIKQDQIAALKEYKTSLINAAVTGKIKVI